MSGGIGKITGGNEAKPAGQNPAIDAGHDDLVAGLDGAHHIGNGVRSIRREEHAAGAFLEVCPGAKAAVSGGRYHHGAQATITRCRADGLRQGVRHCGIQRVVHLLPVECQPENVLAPFAQQFIRHARHPSCLAASSALPARAAFGLPRCRLIQSPVLATAIRSIPVLMPSPCNR
ncbi:hypothetical protein D3C86_1370750 [compost metagenome]